MIFNFSLKRNFDQRNKIIEIGGWSVPMSYSRCQWDNPVWVTTLMRQLRFWYQKWTQVPLKWYYSYPIPSNTFISKHQEIKIVYAKYFEMAKLSFSKVLSQSLQVSVCSNLFESVQICSRNDDRIKNIQPCSSYLSTFKLVFSLFQIAKSEKFSGRAILFERIQKNHMRKDLTIICFSRTLNRIIYMVSKSHNILTLVMWLIL